MAPPESEGLTLRLFDGIHVGAERALADGETVVIGCGDDCDVILSDAGVAVHHCYLGVRDGAMSLRAMDAPVKIDGETVRPGDPHVLAPFAMVALGSASFAAGPRWSEQWRSLARADGAAGGDSGLRNPSLRWAAWLLGLGLLAIAVGWYWGARPGRTLTGAQERTELAAVIHEMKIDGVTVKSDGKDGPLEVSGVIAKPESVAALRSALAERGLDDVKFTVRDGPSVAADLHEQLRMADPPVDADTHWVGKGLVSVTGHFGDEQALDKALKSASVQQFNDSLDLNVKIVNLDRLHPDFTTSDPGKQITSVVDGDLPYLVTADQSRYYVGSTLPQGGVFEGLDGDRLLVRDETGMTRRYDLSKVAPDASLVDYQTEVQDERE